MLRRVDLVREGARLEENPLEQALELRVEQRTNVLTLEEREHQRDVHEGHRQVGREPFRVLLGQLVAKGRQRADVMHHVVLVDILLPHAAAHVEGRLGHVGE